MLRGVCDNRRSPAVPGMQSAAIATWEGSLAVSYKAVSYIIQQSHTSVFPSKELEPREYTKLHTGFYDSATNSFQGLKANKCSSVSGWISEL